MIDGNDELRLRAEKDALHMLTAYLLYERREETQLRIAFAALIAERHHHFHDLEGNDTPFTECGNEICIKGLAMLQSARKPRIEINQLSIDLVKEYNLVVTRDIKEKVCIAFLEEQNTIVKPDSTILKVDA